jgi:hypothetical protein
MSELCIRCHKADAPEPLGYCTACALNARLEAVGGFKQLGSYLSAWAAFEAWLLEREPGTP